MSARTSLCTSQFPPSKQDESPLFIFLFIRDAGEWAQGLEHQATALMM